jgi:3-oxoacyl-[acyl-carrier protein] reductase
MIHIDLTGKRALVCGSTQGIGYAIATELARAGASVILAARNESVLKRVAEELPPVAHEPHNYICADFSKRDDVEHALRTFLDVQGNPPIHVLVNNTGGPPPGAILEASSSAFMDALSQHLLVNQLLVQMLVPAMKAERYGRIINIISTSVKQPIPNLGVSNTTRGAVNSWAKTLSFELAPFGITVNNLLPGYISTGRLESLASSIAQRGGKAVGEVEAEMLTTIPAGRFGAPSELGYIAAFLASPLAAYITGTSLAVDGGRTTAL